MIRVAATGDVHFGRDSAGTLRPHLEHLSERADLFLVAGDLTKCGEPEEAAVLADELAGLDVPTIAVLGNHDYHTDRPDEIRDVLTDRGVRVLDCENEIVDVDGVRVVVTGAKGFGGGFAGACGSDFGEPEMKAFIRHTKEISSRVEALLKQDDADVRVALLHYSPVEDTLRGERLEIYPSLGAISWLKRSIRRVPTWSSTDTRTTAPRSARHRAERLYATSRNRFCATRTAFTA